MERTADITIERNHSGAPADIKFNYKKYGALLNSLFIFIFAIFVLTSCHKDDESNYNDSILGIWYQTVDDNTHWISFTRYEKGDYGCSYTVTPKGGDPNQFLWDTKGTYSVDKDNKIVIYLILPEYSSQHGVWLSGNISNSTIVLSNSIESYQLTKYIQK